MFDFISGKFIGLDTTVENFDFFGGSEEDRKPLEKHNEIRNESYRKQSLEVCRDIRTPKQKTLRKPITLESIIGRKILKDFGITKEEFLKGIFPKTFVDDKGITRELNPEFLKWIFANRNDSPEEFTEKIEKKNKEFREKNKVSA